MRRGAAFLFLTFLAQGAQAYDFVLPQGKIIILGDSQPQGPLSLFGREENTDSVRPQVLKAIADEQAKVVFHIGDFVFSGFFNKNIRPFRGWETHERELCAIMGCGPNFFPVIGNHDYGGFLAGLPKAAKKALKNYFEQFPHLPGRTYYSVLVGSALFVALDSNFARFNSEQLKAQIAWAQETLKQAQVDPNVDIVLPYFHHQAYSNMLSREKRKQSKKVQKHFISLFKEFPKIRATFSGHVHTYEHIPRDGIDHIVTGIGPRGELKTGKDREYEDIYPGGGALRPFHYLRLTPQVGGMMVEMVMLDGGAWKVGEKFVLKAKADRIFEGS